MKKRIDEILNSLDGVHRATPQPFFYTRLKARMEPNGRGVWENVGSFISRPVMLIATVCFIILLNIVVLYKNHTSSIQVTATDQMEQISGDAFDVASNSNNTIYNIWSQDNDQRIQ